MLVPIKGTGQFGVNKDLSQHELPNNVWTDAQNVRFLDGTARQFLGHKEYYNPPTIVPYHVLPVTVSGAAHWIYPGATKIYMVTGTTHTNITRQTAAVDVDYTANRNSWTSTVLGGIPILNNGYDTPQQWLLTGKCTDLTNFPASTKCAVLRAYKNSLVALDVTKSGTRYPYMIKWSHPADPGTVPSTWDETDPTKDAGELDVADGYDYIIDGMALRDYFVIYKQNSVHRLDYIGGVFVYKEGKVLGTSGAMNRNCIAEIDGQHFVLTTEDVIIHDGFQPQSVLDKQTRRHLFANIDATNYVNSFVFKNQYFNELFVCYPEGGHTVPNKAMVWNWVDKTVSFRDIPNLNHAAIGKVVNSSDGLWASDTESWDEDTTTWANDSGSRLDVTRVLMASNDTKLFLLDETTTFNGTPIEGMIERQGLSFDAPDRIKLARGIRARISGTAGSTVLVYLGAADTPYDAPVYGDAITYTIGETVECFGFASGRYLAVKFVSGTSSDWRLDSYEWDVNLQGKW